MPTASEIIERVKARYAWCRSYEDTGEMAARLSAPRISTEQPFRTLFQRDEGLRFELTNPGAGPRTEQMRGVGWSRVNGGMWWSLPSMRRLGRTIDVSRTMGEIGFAPSAVAALSLLGPKFGRNSAALSPKADVKLDTLNSVECFVLCHSQGPFDGRIWIEASSYIIRQCVDRVELAGIVTDSTIVWHPRMDHAIDPKVFEFVEPG